ncbi:MAG: cupin domain-containing protein [Chitinophagales bacterium]|nr:cupin domain-containing protein [Chitinophagales bacterium]MDW8393726.1 cupin domain-containing protein [Chitinophagales bacterium]
MRWWFLFVLFIAGPAAAQKAIHLPSVKTKNLTDGVVVQKLFGDSTVSSNLLWIREEVRPHFHSFHSEHVYVVEGTAQMLFNHETLFLRAGDLVFIPAGTVHAVRPTGKDPLRVLSIHSPAFDGSDRVLVEKTGW